MTAPWRRPALAVALAGLLAACAGAATPVIWREYIAPTYGPKLLNSAGQSRQVPAEIVGNPFAAAKPALDAAVMRAVRETAYGSRIPLTTTPQADLRPAFRLVAIFAPSRTIGPFDVCTGSRRQAQAPAGPLVLMLTYCFNDQPLSSLRARSTGLRGPDDPAFARFVRNAAAVLFQMRREDADGRDDDFLLD